MAGSCQKVCIGAFCRRDCSKAGLSSGRVSWPVARFLFALSGDYSEPAHLDPVVESFTATPSTPFYHRIPQFEVTSGSPAFHPG
jgi:hypothetical protein